MILAFKSHDHLPHTHTHIVQQKFGIKTAGLDEKCTAMQMLVVYAKDLKTGFADFAEPVSLLHLSYDVQDCHRLSWDRLGPGVGNIVKNEGSHSSKTRNPRKVRGIPGPPLKCVCVCVCVCCVCVCLWMFTAVCVHAHVFKHVQVCEYEVCVHAYARF